MNLDTFEMLKNMLELLILISTLLSQPPIASACAIIGLLLLLSLPPSDK